MKNYNRRKQLTKETKKMFAQTRDGRTEQGKTEEVVDVDADDNKHDEGEKSISLDNSNREEENTYKTKEMELIMPQ